MNYPTFPPEVGFSMYSTVYDDDPTRVVISAGSLLRTYTDDVIAKSPFIVVTITDHLGSSNTAQGSDCTIGEATKVLSRTVNIMPMRSRAWKVDIGMCPRYAAGT